MTTGLNVAADRLDVCRVLKEESSGKDVRDLTDEDFTCSVTKVNVSYLGYDKEKQQMYTEPVKASFEFTLPDKQDLSALGAEEAKDQSVLSDALNKLQLTATLTGATEGMAEYSFY
ncbi:MAG: hypothetical protein J6Y13_07630, partial [Treponema sp.]|nr:hypothetical protein [Treponema sp.]